MTAPPDDPLSWVFRPVGDDSGPTGCDALYVAPRPAGERPAAVVRHVASRESQLLRRRVSPPRCGHVDRIPAHGTSPLGRRLRAGVLVAPATGAGRRVIDEVAAAADLVGPLTGLRPVAGGLLLARGRLRTGHEVVLRVGPAGTEPWSGHEIVAALHGLEVRVPRPVDSGIAAGAAWATESVLDGRTPRRGTAQTVRAVVRQLVRFPVVDAPLAALDDVRGIQRAIPHRSVDAAALGEQIAGGAAPLPMVPRHGDLWMGNVLLAPSGAAGVVDWDAAHWGGLPGTDLLQLLATADRHRRHESLGAAWLRRPWLSTDFAAACGPLWAALAVEPDHDALGAIGLAWWAAEVAGTLRRYPARADDEPWLSRNVDPVLARVALGA